MKMFGVYMKLRDSPYWPLFKGKSQQCGGVKSKGSQTTAHVNFNITGIADIVNESCVTELKFTR